ncbi:hypothetical protein GCM10027261_24630 [Geodermatophilus arenarius]|uniref:PASTA domain-containing protein n=1 Tax=Geodermatophilus arenarius TaxID=1137990 RepID=A0ABV9LIS2_9ACTN
MSQPGSWDPFAGAATPWPPAQPEPPAPAGPRRWRGLAVGGVVLLLLGVLVLGAGIGWTTHAAVDRPDLADTTVQVVDAPTDDAGTAAEVPDVRGLALVDARQALADAGLDPAALSTVDTPSALPAGSVVRQDPVGGSPGAGPVTLYVAVSGTVPALVATDGDAAVATLTELGVAARVVRTYDPAVAEGTVLALDPPAGSPLPKELQLTVAGPPSSVFLTDLDAEGGCGIGEAASNGTTYGHALSCSAGSSPRRTTYLLDRLGTTVEGTVGVLDRGDAGFTGSVVVRGDGRELFRADVRFGAATPFAVPVGGVLQLTVEVVATSTTSGTVVLGDPRVVGAPDAIDTLAGS